MLSTDEISVVLLGHECVLHVEGYISQWPCYSKATRWVTPPCTSVLYSDLTGLCRGPGPEQYKSVIMMAESKLFCCLCICILPSGILVPMCGNLVQVSLAITETLQEKRVQPPQGVVAECSLPMALFQLDTNMCGIFCEPRKVPAKHPSPVRDAK